MPPARKYLTIRRHAQTGPINFVFMNKSSAESVKNATRLNFNFLSNIKVSQLISCEKPPRLICHRLKPTVKKSTFCSGVWIYVNRHSWIMAVGVTTQTVYKSVRAQDAFRTVVAEILFGQLRKSFSKLGGSSWKLYGGRVACCCFFVAQHHPDPKGWIFSSVRSSYMQDVCNYFPGALWAVNCICILTVSCWWVVATG